MNGFRDIYNRTNGRTNGAKLTFNEPTSHLAGSLDEVFGDLRILVRACVRMYVCTYVTLLLENRSLLFSETLQLVRACKCEKNFPSAFLKKIPVSLIFPKNCPKWGILAQNAQKWRFFAFFLESLHYFFLKLCS